MKPKLLVVELWGIGDLVLTTPFLRAAAGQFELTLLAKPLARELQPRLWPGVEVMPFAFPWTAFKEKYNLMRWPWRDLASLARQLRLRRFDIAVSARWDPRDHFLLGLTGATRRVGFPRLGSGLFLSERLLLPGPDAHRYENWRVLGRHLGIELPAKGRLATPLRKSDTILIHSGAAQPARVWPLERFQVLAAQLRQNHCAVQIVCDPAQREWWVSHGENVLVPAGISELMAQIDGAGPWQRLRLIIVPIILPVIEVTLLLGFVFTVKVFDLIIALTGGGPANVSQLITTWSYNLSFQQFSFGEGAALNNVLLVLALICSPLYLLLSRGSLRRSSGEGK